MLVNWTQPKHVFIVCGKTDLRKGIDGLAAVVAENYDMVGKVSTPLLQVDYLRQWEGVR